MQLCTVWTVCDWQPLSLPLCAGVQYFQEDLSGLFAASNIRRWRKGGGWEKRYKSVIPSASDGFRCKCTVALRSPSSSENKEGSCGSWHHRAALQGHRARRQQPRSLLCASPLEKRNHLPPPVSAVLSLPFITEKKFSQTWNSRASEMMENSRLCVWHIYIAELVIWIRAWWVKKPELSAAIKIISAACQL